jgi:hypothetical protein
MNNTLEDLFIVFLRQHGCVGENGNPAPTMYLSASVGFYAGAAAMAELFAEGFGFKYFQYLQNKEKEKNKEKEI